MTDTATRENESSGVRQVRLDVAGMSCGACSRRVEKALNNIDGVRASVDIGTKVATIDVGHEISVSDLCEVVRQAGYLAEECPAGSIGPGQGGETGQSRSSGAARFIGWLTLGHMGGAGRG
ncbi:heavy-metal-associated domain-containing protein [Mycobacterium sp. 141]|uniref:heavy-metal-associated domain-containing protein n=1 Tax=Mycobacterium sp. 141 TaxID=1120797 RepID=UPI001E2F9F65|nr:heavy metal-associated domain-containing protein [Mycobacterium sp. 141]